MKKTLTIKEIKSRTTEGLIAIIFHSYTDETKTCANTLRKICKELERRNVIDNADYLYTELYR